MTTSRTPPRPVALVTGASRGLGRAVAADLAAAGHHVVIDARDPAALGEAAAALPAGRVTAVPGDVTDPAHRARLAEEARRLGRLDLLVNNAGALGPAPPPPLAGLRPADMRALLEANVVAPLALVQATLPLLARSGGAIVNVTSDASVEPYEGWGGYGASKAALDHVSAVLAVEHPGVRVYALDPGEMDTDMLRAAMPGEDVSDRPAPEEVASAVRALWERRPPSGRVRAADVLAGVAP